ncbi:MAG: glycosyl hydrolase-related protein, partial [Treponema sp.]|nr:glycosyl hydrolase-related protein [Treponema sp.]
PEADAGKNLKRLVVRLYESSGGRRTGNLRFSRPVASAEETDMLEENGRSVQCTDSYIPLVFKPFEIKTLLVSFLPGLNG